MNNLRLIDIVCLMAGEGSRFKDNHKYNYTIKPLIKVNGKTILEWTISSLPQNIISNNLITFAIQQKHNQQYNVIDYLYDTFKFIDVVSFNNVTRGNLETAYLTTSKVGYITDKPVLFIDSDNFYGGKDLLTFISGIDKQFFAVVCYFDLIDKTDHKWCFVDINGNRVINVSEKDPTILKNPQPLIGTFYFSSSDMFKKIARHILKTKQPVKNEFYMSQSIKEYINNEIPVFAYKADFMVPLGTPVDVDNFSNLKIY
jgi:choline kinase